MQNERQNEWDWTIIAILSSVYQSLNSDFSLIPEQDETAFGSNAGLKSGVFKGIAAGAGLINGTDMELLRAMRGGWG